MTRKQRRTLTVGAILLVAAILCPPWSYYQGERKFVPPPGEMQREDGDAENLFVPRHSFVQDVPTAHILRALAIIAIFIGTTALYLRYAAEDDRADERAASGEAEKSTLRSYWAVTIVICAIAVAVPFVLALIYLIRGAR